MLYPYCAVHWLVLVVTVVTVVLVVTVAMVHRCLTLPRSDLFANCLFFFCYSFLNCKQMAKTVKTTFYDRETKRTPLMPD